MYKFPENFLWGTASSSHQIEGGNKNTWTQWEQSPERLDFLHKKYEKTANFISGKASNSWEMLDVDIECIKKLNNNAYRFSIEWSRIEPQEGKFDEAALAKYSLFIKKLRTNNIEPIVTLWHWPLPIWLGELGGWSNSKIITYFERYAEQVVKIMGHDLKYINTLNEPMVYATHSYLRGDWPPQEKNIFKYYSVINNLIKAHKKAYSIIKQYQPEVLVGIAKHNIYFEPFANKFINKVSCRILNWFWNERFLNKIKNYQDFIGLNYYFHAKINGFKSCNDNKKVSDLGWELYPEGLYQLIIALKKFKLPVIITEHGLADESDSQRAWYLTESLKQVYRAIQFDVPVVGYCHWSLLDNFEWALGFSPKFGFYEVDHANNFQRNIRPSGLVYQEICKNNQI